MHILKNLRNSWQKLVANSRDTLIETFLSSVTLLSKINKSKCDPSMKSVALKMTENHEKCLQMHRHKDNVIHFAVLFTLNELNCQYGNHVSKLMNHTFLCYTMYNTVIPTHQWQSSWKKWSYQHAPNWAYNYNTVYYNYNSISVKIQLVLYCYQACFSKKIHSQRNACCSPPLGHLIESSLTRWYTYCS